MTRELQITYTPHKVALGQSIEDMMSLHNTSKYTMKQKHHGVTTVLIKVVIWLENSQI